MFKYILLIAIISSASAHSPAIVSIDPQYQLLINGFLEGSGLNALVPDLSGCETGSAKIIDSISRAIEAFKKTPMTTDDIAYGIKNIGIAVEAIGVAAKTCLSIPITFTKIYKYFSAISSDPSTYINGMGKNAISNLMRIVGDLLGINSLFDQKNYFEVGKRTGEVAKWILYVDMPKKLKFLE